MIVTDEMLAVLDQSSGPVGLLECIEVSHPNWPRVLRYIVNSSESINLTHEDGQTFTYSYAPLNITRSNEEENLDQKITAAIGDVGSEIPELVDRILQDAVKVSPILNYRAYVIGKYDTPCTFAKDLEVIVITRDWKGTSFEAQAPGLNNSGNGEIYSASTDPSLEGFYS
ncbi:DUF1833 family protein [Acinetobacter seifertii]|uniref:DUF1833 family protein n=1 Tax=Acinetobacter seifertii TaxID=1530123 RepID=A0A7H2SSU1_9GAMM|nr:DUF1833 family protein [Acinetobacter seifertii]MBD1224934.1 DUF1833 family protein [Acinetobacter seifertii]MBD1229794.1 DUF1833 family protein [Acinetobacter seifertii]QNX10698.1 DUF1833 family protein [Acinetobacter seifertii]QNX27998.1 DUF1833 family protein [Acinetobacter seifertii]QNX39049.1 DUF1833 family protein [Acinetobacter seifertii]